MTGNEVRIYHDPQNMQQFEGSARVVKVHFSNGETSYCRVRFLAGPSPRTLDRWVDNEQLDIARGNDASG